MDMPLPTHAVFLNNVRRRMRELGMTQAEFADAMGWSEGYVSQLLKGRSVPSLAMPDRVAPALKTTAQYLLTPDCPELIQDSPQAPIDSTLQIC